MKLVKNISIIINNLNKSTYLLLYSEEKSTKANDRTEVDFQIWHKIS